MALLDEVTGAFWLPGFILHRPSSNIIHDKIVH